MKQILQEKFNGKGDAHQSVICSQKNCSSLKNIDVGKSGKFKSDKFKHAWLNEFWWLTFHESADNQLQSGMYCILCTKHKIKGERNKTVNPFSDIPSKFQEECSQGPRENRFTQSQC